MIVEGAAGACRLILDIYESPGGDGDRSDEDSNEENYSHSVNAKDVHGRTPLHLATIGGHGEVVNLLCEHGGTFYGN